MWYCASTETPMHYLLITNQQEEFNYKSPGSIARALVLSVSVCYHARLQKREEYENVVVKCFTGPIHLPGGVEQFRDEIRWYFMNIVQC